MRMVSHEHDRLTRGKKGGGGRNCTYGSILSVSGMLQNAHYMALHVSTFPPRINAFAKIMSYVIYN